MSIRILAACIALSFSGGALAQENTLTRTKGPNALKMPQQKTLTRTKPVRKVGKKLVPVSTTVMTGVASLFNTIKSTLTLRRNKSELDRVLSDTKHGGREFFRKFAESEWSGENFNALAGIQDYRRAPTVKKLDDLVKKYFSKGAPQEVNAQVKLFQALRQARLSVRDSTITPATKTALADLEQALMINLSDTYSRFVLGDSYQEWKRRTSLGGKIVDGIRKLDHETLQVEKNVHDTKTLVNDLGQGVKKVLTKKKPAQQQQ